MTHKRLYKSILGTPLWLLVALCVFLITSTLYDGLASIIPKKYILISAFSVLIIAILLNLIKVETIRKISSNSLGK